MTEIIKLIHQLDNELNECKEEVRRLAGEQVIDTFKVIELCNRMNNIMAVGLLLNDVNGKLKIKTISGYN